MRTQALPVSCNSDTLIRWSLGLPLSYKSQHIQLARARNIGPHSFFSTNTSTIINIPSLSSRSSRSTTSLRCADSVILAMLSMLTAIERFKGSHKPFLLRPHWKSLDHGSGTLLEGDVEDDRVPITLSKSLKFKFLSESAIDRLDICDTEQSWCHLIKVINKEHRESPELRLE
jgi:hypothetical protein